MPERSTSLHLVCKLPQHFGLRRHITEFIVHCESANYFGLPRRRNGSVARKCRQTAFMPEVLRPSLERFGVELPVIGDLNERVPEQVRIEIRQPRTRAAFAKN